MPPTATAIRQIPPHEAAAELLRRRRARSSLLAFTEYTKDDYRTNWHHRVIAEALDRWERGESPRMMVFAPPQHGKSELDNRRLPAYTLGRNPDRRILSCSYAMNLAQSMNRDVQRIIDSPQYRALFPDTRVSDSRDEYRKTMSYFEVVGHEGFLRSCGVTQGIAGYPADCGIIDDPFGSRDDAESKVIRDRVEEWYWGDFIGRLSKNAPILIVHTRWNQDDLAGRRIRGMVKDGGEQWEILTFQGLKTTTYSHPADPREPGEALWPEHKSEADLAVIKRENPRVFSALYQQDPQAAGSEWPNEWFGDWLWFDKWPDGHLGVRVGALDSSKGSSGRLGDYSAIVVVHWHDGVLYVDADMDNARHWQGIADACVAIQRFFGTSVFAVEEEFGGDVLGEEIYRRAANAGILFPLVPIGTGGFSKISRIRRLGTFLSRGLVRFKRNSPGSLLLMQQLREFPFGDHDDGPDALEMAIRELNRFCCGEGSELTSSI